MKRKAFALEEKTEITFRRRSTRGMEN